MFLIKSQRFLSVLCIMDNISNNRLKKAKGIIEINSSHTKQINIMKQLLGLMTYIIIFVIAIPVSLYKLKLFTILESYLPNIDLLATCLSWYGGPHNIWTELYPSATVTVYGFLSKSLINYGALLGLTYIIARESDRTNNAIKGWSLGLIMLLMTYLLPSNLITHIMNVIQEHVTLTTANYLMITIIGILVAICIILAESYIINRFRYGLINIGKSIIQFPSNF